MATTGNYFQTYLKRALENLEIAERERDGPAPGDFAAPASGTCIVVYTFTFLTDNI